MSAHDGKHTHKKQKTQKTQNGGKTLKEKKHALIFVRPWKQTGQYKNTYPAMCGLSLFFKGGHVNFDTL